MANTETTARWPAWAPLVARATVAAGVALFVLRRPTPTPGLPAGGPATFETEPVVAIVAIVVGALFFFFGKRLRRLAEAIPRVAVDVVLFAVVVAIVRHVTRAGFGDTPVIQDETAYDLLARRMANGTAVLASQPLGEMERIRFLVDDGRNYPLFQPGWPAFLSLFWRLRVPALAPAVATALLVVGSSRLCDRLYGRLASLLTVIVLLGSSFFLVLGGSFFSHAFAGALFTLSLERLLAALDESALPRQRVVSAALAGAAAAWLFLTRIPIAAAYAAVALTVIGFSYRRQLGYRSLMAFALVAALGPLLQMRWNSATTGHAFELPQDRYFALTEPNPRCHRLGFGAGIGCVREHPFDVPPKGFTARRAVDVTATRWSVLRTDAWSTPLPFLAAALFLLRRPDRRTALVVAGVLMPMAVYFAFYYHALLWGARLYLETLPFFAMAISAFLVAPAEVEAPKPKVDVVARLAAAGVLSMMLMIGVYEVTERLPARYPSIGKGGQARRVRENLDRAGVHHAIVYLQNCMVPDRADVVLGWAIANHTEPPESRDRWFVRDFGYLHDQQMVALHPDWRHVRADCNGARIEDVAPPIDGRLVSQAEAKFPPDSRQHAFGMLEASPGAGNEAVLRVTFLAADGAYRFRQWVPRAGAYDVTVTSVARPDAGRFRVLIDGIPAEPTTPVQLTAGLHMIELAPVDWTRPVHVTIDQIELRPH